MQSAPKLYRVEMQLDRAAGTSPAWMVAALRAKYGDAELVRVESYGASSAQVVVRSRSAAPTTGDQIVPFSESLQVPAEALPTATVRQVSEIQLVQGGPAEAIEASATSQERVAIRLATAAGILLAVVFLTRRVVKPS